MSAQKNDLKGMMAQLESKLEYYFVTKAPFALPDNVKEFIVKYGPWIMVVLLVMTVPGVLFMLGIGAVLTPFAALASPQASAQMMVGGVVSVVSLVLEAAAIPGLLKRKLSGWRLAYYATLVSAVYSIITFNVGGLIIGTLISLYILFQVKHKYS